MPRLGVAFASLFLTLALLEIGLRAVGYDPMGKAIRSMRQEPGQLLELGLLRELDHDVLVYDLAPNEQAFAWGSEVRTNSYGFRDEDWKLEKAASTLRCVCLGDSATFGVKLSREEAWPQTLERISRAEGVDLETLNLGIVGYDILDIVTLFEERGLAFSPDIVALAIHLNDVGYASPSREYIRRLNTYGSPLYRLRLLQGLRQRLDLISSAKDQLRRESDEVFLLENRDYMSDVSADEELARLQRRFGSHLDRLEDGDRFVRLYASPDRIARVRYALEKLSRLSQQNGFRVAVFIVPWMNDEGREDAYDAAYAILEHEVERLGFSFVETARSIRSAGHERLRIESNDHGHPNAVGQALFADRLLELFLREEWVPN